MLKIILNNIIKKKGSVINPNFSKKLLIILFLKINKKINVIIIKKKIIIVEIFFRLKNSKLNEDLIEFIASISNKDKKIEKNTS
tara:strand:- start:170 stop:421 length:252 start_codon:yes stop_codon:yes gene_type:complete